MKDSSISLINSTVRELYLTPRVSIEAILRMVLNKEKELMSTRMDLHTRVIIGEVFDMAWVRFTIQVEY